MNMDPKLISAIAYVQSLLTDDIVLTISDNSCICIDKELKELESYKHVIITDNNPIKEILTQLNEQACIDCFGDENNYNDPFFLDLLYAYIQSLVHEFGDNIPIDQGFAKLLCQHSLLNYHLKLVSDEIGEHLVDSYDAMYWLHAYENVKCYIITSE